MRNARINAIRWFWDRISYDLLKGVNTSGIVKLSALSIAGNNASHGVFYEATPYRFGRVALRQLPIVPSEFCFIDLGSGKGRMLLEAARYPFSEVIGVEFSTELHAIAEANIESLNALQRGDTPRIKVICCDAAEFDFPLTDCVLYAFNPFDEVVFSCVLERLRPVTRKKRVLLIYCEAKHHDLVLQSGMFEWRFDIPLPFTFTRQKGWISTLRVYSNFSI